METTYERLHHRRPFRFGEGDRRVFANKLHGRDTWWDFWLKGFGIMMAFVQTAVLVATLVIEFGTKIVLSQGVLAALSGGFAGVGFLWYCFWIFVTASQKRSVMDADQYDSYGTMVMAYFSVNFWAFILLWLQPSYWVTDQANGSFLVAYTLVNLVLNYTMLYVMWLFHVQYWVGFDKEHRHTSKGHRSTSVSYNPDLDQDLEEKARQERMDLAVPERSLREQDVRVPRPESDMGQTPLLPVDRALEVW